MDDADAPWNVLIGGWTLALSLAWPVLVAREIGFRVAGIHDAGAINSWSLMSAPQAAMWILYVVLAQLLGALWFEWARRGRSPASSERDAAVVHALWMGATVASVVAIFQGTVDLGFLSTDFWASAAARHRHDARREFVWGVRGAGRADRHFSPCGRLRHDMRPRASPCLAVNWAGMWMSGSRTALLCAAVEPRGLRDRRLWRERRSHAPAPACHGIGVWIAAVIAVLAVCWCRNDRVRSGACSIFRRDGRGSPSCGIAAATDRSRCR